MRPDGKSQDGRVVTGKRMLTNWYPLVHVTCDACKLAQRQAHNRRLAAKRKAERHAAKADMPAPRCEQCDKVIEDAMRFDFAGRWARRFCGNACRQADFRATPTRTQPRPTTRSPFAERPFSDELARRLRRLAVHQARRRPHSEGAGRCAQLHPRAAQTRPSAAALASRAVRLTI